MLESYSSLEKFTNDDNARRMKLFLLFVLHAKQIQLMSSEIGLNAGRTAEAYSHVL